jgi:hypothetical protein
VTLLSFPGRDNPWVGRGVLLAAVALALVTARDHAGSWNDGSRLATVECLVDHHTLAIDGSVFVRVPPGEPSPYPADNELLQSKGTCDKLLIEGRYYSDKSPVPALLLAGVYQAVSWRTGLTFRERPDAFCYLLTLASSGLAYVVAVWCVYRLGGALRLGLMARLGLTATFGLSTVALPYAAHVNNHSLLLGVSAALMLGLVRLGEARAAGRLPGLLPAGLGTLAGLAYTIDLGAGPVLLGATAALVTYRCPRPGPLAAFALAALPWLALHHAVNYAVGGTLAPANAVAEYFQWPGCPFTPETMTGGWKHDGVGRFALYALALLGGKHGFLGHNLPLFLALPALALLVRRGAAGLPEVLFAVCVCVGVWLMYAVNSNNYSGRCLTVRWFVPLLAPAYYLLAALLRRYPRFLGDLLILGAGGAFLMGLAWGYGPWIKHMVPLFWPVQAATLLAWGGYRVWLWRRERTAAAPEEREQLARAA